MRFHLRMKIKRLERSLERVLGLVGRRGHEIERLVAQPSDGSTLLEVRLTINSERSAEVLRRQIGRLYEVESVEFDSRED